MQTHNEALHILNALDPLKWVVFHKKFTKKMRPFRKKKGHALWKKNMTEFMVSWPKQQMQDKSCLCAVV